MLGLRNKACGLGLDCPRPKVASQGHPARGLYSYYNIGTELSWSPALQAGLGSLGHQLGMTFTKAPPKFSYNTWIIALSLVLLEIWIASRVW